MMRRIHRLLLVALCFSAMLAGVFCVTVEKGLAIDNTRAALHAEDVSARPGSTVSLEVRISNNPGIVGATLEVDYDSRLTLTKIVNGNAFSALEMTKPGEMKPGCRIHWDTTDIDDEDIKDGAIATLTFALSADAVPGSACYVSVAAVSANGQPDVFNRDLDTVALQAARCNVVVDAIPATGVSLDRSTLEFEGLGAQAALVATVTPENASNKDVMWRSSDEGVATVSQDGVVTAVANGVAIVTATTVDGGFSASCEVAVDVPAATIPVSAISLDRPSLTLVTEGEQAQLTANVLPEDATNRAVRWLSTNPSVATVSDEGLVTAVANGSALVMATTVDGGFAATCAVTVDIPVPKVSINDAEVTVAAATYTGEALEPVVVVTLSGKTLVAGSDYTVSYVNNVGAGTGTATVTGVGGYEGTKVVNFAIARATTASPAAKDFTYDGKSHTGITVGAGYTLSGTASATNAGTYTATAMLDANHCWDDGSVGPKPVSWTIAKAAQTVTAANKSVLVSKTVSLGATASAGGKLTYKTSDAKIATVSAAGVVTGVAAGTAKITITAAATENYKSASKVVTVTVNKAAQTITAADKSVVFGKTVSLGAKTSGDGKLTYKFSNTAIAKVSATGVVTPVAKGTAKITITAAETAKCKAATKTITVTVTQAAQTITAANKVVQVKKTVSLAAKTSGNGKLTYKSSNTAVATVSATGVVTGKKVGTAKITITAAATGQYKQATKTITVTVKNANTLTSKAKKATVAASFTTLKSKAVTLASNVTVTGAKGTVSYANASTDATAKKFKVDAATGKITVPKGTKKGKYQVKVKVTAKGTSTYMAGSKTVSYHIQVK